MASDTIFTSSFSQQRWVNQIAKIMTTHTITIDIHETFAISTVPETLVSEKPDAYTPQHIGLGPYHHLCPSLYKMEFQKMAAVKAILSSDQVQNFTTSFIGKVKELEPRIRACYDRYLDLDCDTLAWIMAIDALFLFTQLSCTTTEEDVVRDMLMLENQIPTFVITEMLTLLADSNYNQLLNSKVLDFCELNSPLKLTEQSRFRQAGYSHLLDCMYNLIVNNRGVVENGSIAAFSAAFSTASLIIDDAQKVMDAAGGMAALAGVPQIKTFFTFIKTLPCDQFLSLCSSSSKEDSKVADEIKIPSVSLLRDVAKVKFCVTRGGIRDVKFDAEELTFHLPVITLNKNKCSETVLRNLVAYEAVMKSNYPGESLEMAEYVDLMCGIIDTAKDVEQLRGNGIVVGDLGDEEIAKMFNGMNRSTGMSNGGRKYELEETVEKVNESFDNRLRVRIYRGGKNFMDKYVYGSWKALVLLATITLLLLTVLQSFCSIYGCSERFSLKMVASV